MRTKTGAAIAAGLACAPYGAAAGDLDVGFAIAGELRYFPQDPLFAEQFDDFQPSLVFEPELDYESDDRAHQIRIAPFARLDAQDEARTHVDLREAYYRYNADDWALTVGLARVFWGRTESRHLVDIINQVDAVEDIDEEDRLGQPMVNLTLLNDWGAIDLFVLPGFRTRTFPGEDGRLRFQLPVDTDAPIFEREAKRGAVDFAARYSHYIGPVDFGVSGFWGSSREPRFNLDQANGRIRPVYDRIAQASIDIQYTQGAWLWKGEALYREGHGDGFFAAVGGLEYTLFQAIGDADLGLLAEYQHDGRDSGLVLEDFGPTLAAPITVADNDVFFGARLALNDLQNTAILAGATIDVEKGSKGIFLEAERRFGENWTGELQARLFVDVDEADAAFQLRNDDFLNLRVTRYF